MKNTGILIVVLAAFMLHGCDFLRKHPREDVVAECYGKYLFVSDLEGIVPENTDVMDSIIRVNAFIDSWIQRQVLLHHAESNLAASGLDFGKQLDDYRNSLVIYSYETQLINQRLDTVVTEEEMERYYEERKDDFQVRNTMVKVAYVIVDDNCKQKDMFAKLLRNKDTLMLQNIGALADDYAFKSHLDIDHWMSLDDLTTAVPLEIRNAENFLKKNQFVSLGWNDYTCMVRFVDYLLEESVSPYDLVKHSIKSIILERRKKELIDRMKTALYEKARKNHDFKVYAGQPFMEEQENNNETNPQ